MTITTNITRPRRDTLNAAPSQFSLFRAIWARAVADRSTVIGVLAFYGLAIGAGVGALWIPLKDVFAEITLPSGFDGILGGLALDSPAGWVNAELLSIMGPGFLIAAAIVSAGAATAGEEQNRTLGLVLATGASRTTFLVAKTAGMVTHVLIVAAGMFLGLLTGNAIGDLGLSTADMLAATIWMVLIALVYGAIALAVGALTGDKRITMAVSAGLAAVSFVLSIFLPLKESLTDWAKVNLWYPYSGNIALVDGIDWGLAAIMVAISVAVSLVGFIGFARRSDLRG